ncbi:thiamine-phosphate synthase [Capnocytophaga stomatis]|uniref:thiamine phosphate synthase n=1 Tax=Capnocytophaga stomatis TaxID=1848904 RepID=UPI0019529DF8|nr:thiamine phosphate synthase [Capnocytophaga stomatis]GIJ95193.1 thiamine-phosphate synthase [Capnocytophaga stomatis]
MQHTYYISQGKTAEEQLANIQKVLDCGGKLIQLRWKTTDPTALSELAVEVKNCCQKHNALLIINDNPDVAQKVDADGVHLGLQDSSVASARTLLGTKKIIGGTANTLQDVLQRIAEGCDYIGLGPFRFTTTKEKLSPILGVEGFQKILHHLKKNNLSSPPIYAIGGIELGDISLLKKCGLYGVAISGLLTEKPELLKQIESTFTENENSR